METVLALMTVVSLLSAVLMAAFAYRLNERWYEQLDEMNHNWADFCRQINESWANHADQQVERVIEKMKADSEEA